MESVNQQPSASTPAAAPNLAPPTEPAPQPAVEPAPPATFPPSQSPAAARPAARGGSGRILNIVLGIAVALAIGGVAFAAGRLTAPAPASAFGNRGPGQVFGNGGNGDGTGNGNRGNGQGGPGGFLAGGGLTLQGTVESVTATTLTLKTASGQTIQVALDGTTTYHAQSDGSATDVTNGKTVLVRITGFRRAGGPGASFAPGNGGITDQTASDVTVVP